MECDHAGDPFAGAPLLMNVPVRYYTMFFRPQLWAFFIFDFEHAFSFYWCAKIFGLLLACGWMFRQIGVQSPLLAGFGALWIFLSSFTQWWFSSPSMLPEMIASWAMATGCAVKLFSPLSRRHLLLAAIGFIFFAANFVLCVYPSFQIPLAYIFVAVITGVGLKRRADGNGKLKQGATTLALCVVILVLLLVPYWLEIRGTLKIIAQTGYPGTFRSSGGGLSIAQLFSGVTGFFESETSIPRGFINICEASNFYPLWPAAMCAIAFGWWKHRIPISPMMIALIVIIVVLSIYCVLPFPSWLARSSLLALAVERRLIFGVGIANILLCCLVLDSYSRLSMPWRFALPIAGCFSILAALEVWAIAPPNTRFYTATVMVINCALIALFFFPWRRLIFLAVFTLALLPNVAINPLMIGLAPLLRSHAFAEIDLLRRSDPATGWVVYESWTLPALVKATGALVFNGTKFVPDLPLMEELDPDKSNRSSYNRYASIYVDNSASGEVTYGPVWLDLYRMTLPPDSPVLQRRGYNYVLFPREWWNASLHGFSLVRKIDPAGLYVYRRESSSR
jgi:hypothetical protein